MPFWQFTVIDAEGQGKRTDLVKADSISEALDKYVPLMDDERLTSVMEVTAANVETWTNTHIDLEKDVQTLYRRTP